jgi:cytochrome c oxidase assembly factor CtaG
MLYLLAAMPVMSVLGVWLVIAHTVRYPAYAASSHALGVSPLHDQRVAGVIMWCGDAVLGAVTLVIACRALLAEERRAVLSDAYGDAPGRPVGLGGGVQ